MSEHTPTDAAPPDDPSVFDVHAWNDVVLGVRDRVRDDHVMLTAAGVAFFFFLALVPLLAAAVSAYGLVADPGDVVVLIDSLGSSLPAGLSNLLREQLTTVTSADRGALGFGVFGGIASGVWSASSGFGHLIEGLNIAYDEDEGRPFWRRRLLALTFTLGFVALIGVATFVVATAPDLVDGGASNVALAGGWIIVACLSSLFLAVLYRYGPNRDEPRWLWVSPGSVFAVAAWTLLSIGFGMYVSRFGSYNDTYGSLGAVVVVLTWMYFTAVVVMLGAEITNELERQTADENAPDSSMSSVLRSE